MFLKTLLNLYLHNMSIIGVMKQSILLNESDQNDKGLLNTELSVRDCGSSIDNSIIEIIS